MHGIGKEKTKFASSRRRAIAVVFLPAFLSLVLATTPDVSAAPTSACALLLKTVIDPISSAIEGVQNWIAPKKFAFDEAVYRDFLDRYAKDPSPEMSVNASSIEAKLARVDALLLKDGVRFRTVDAYSNVSASASERKRIIQDLRKILQTPPSKGVERRRLAEVAKGIYALQNGLPYHSYEVLLRTPGKNVERIVESRVSRFLFTQSLENAFHSLGYEVISESQGRRLLDGALWSLRIPVKLLGLGEPEIKMLRLRLEEKEYREMLNSQGYEVTVRTLLKKHGHRLKNEARLNSALAVGGAAFSAYATWTLGEWIFSCDDGADLPIGKLPKHACGDAQELSADEAVAEIMRHWQKDNQIDGAIIPVDDPDYIATESHYRSQSEDELRRLIAKIRAQEKSL